MFLQAADEPPLMFFASENKDQQQVEHIRSPQADSRLEPAAPGASAVVAGEKSKAV